MFMFPFGGIWTCFLEGKQSGYHDGIHHICLEKNRRLNSSDFSNVFHHEFSLTIHHNPYYAPAALAWIPQIHHIWKRIYPPEI